MADLRTQSLKATKHLWLTPTVALSPVLANWATAQVGPYQVVMSVPMFFRSCTDDATAWVLRSPTGYYVLHTDHDRPIISTHAQLFMAQSRVLAYTLHQIDLALPLLALNHR